MVNYYVDYVNGADTKSGLREPVTSHNHVDSSAANTSTVCAALLSATNDFYNGATIWNRTRGIGAIVSDYDGASKTLTHGAITGHVATDEFYIVNAWKTLSKAATTLAAGDICYMRAGTTDAIAATIEFTNDGTYANQIRVIGMADETATLETTDETATEAWHDASTARPIIDLGGVGSTKIVSIQSDDYWELKNFWVKGSGQTGSNNLWVDCLYVTLTNCKFSGHVTSNYANVGLGNNYANSSWQKSIINNCQFYGSAWAVCPRSGDHIFTNCTFDADTGGYVGLYPNAASGYQVNSRVYLDNCTFGGTAAFGWGDVSLSCSTRIIARNTKFLSGTKIYDLVAGGVLFEYNAQRVFGDNITTRKEGIISRDVSVVRSGGATSSAKMMPSASCSPTYPLSMTNPHGIEPDLRVWCPASATTITVYVRSVTTWGGTYPTAAQLYLEASYISNATSGSCASTTVVSTQVLSDATTWVGLSITCTPAVASFVDLKVVLNKYTASNGIYVDIKPVIS